LNPPPKADIELRIFTDPTYSSRTADFLERVGCGLYLVATHDEQAIPMTKIFETLKHEFLEVLPPTIYFFVALHIVAYVRILMTKGIYLSPIATTSIAVAALILGKAVLIADWLPLINRYPEKPLIYNVAWKTGIYLLIATAIHYLERLFEFSREAGGLAAGNQKLLAEIVWPHFWAAEIIIFVLIVAYCTMRELARVIGRDRMLRLFVGPAPLPTF
jgi:hypothetical protein